MNPAHLIDQAVALATRGVGRPRQTDLRRAVSAAYYAVFHQLTQDAARRVAADPKLRRLVARQLDHGTMKALSKLFGDGTPPGSLRELVPTVPDPLRDVANLFVLLQQARHTADYDLRAATDLNRQEALNLVEQARAALQLWATVRDTPAGEVFLLALLLPKLGTRA